MNIKFSYYNLNENMKIRLAKKIMKKVYKTRYWAYRFGYYHGKKDSGKIAGDHRLIKAIKLTKSKAYE